MPFPPLHKLRRWPRFLIPGCAVLSLAAAGFDVDTSPQPEKHPPEVPVEGERVSVNPPSMVWRVDKRAASYGVEFSPDRSFPEDSRLIRVENIPYSFYNYSSPLAPGQWFWRYFVKTADGRLSRPGPVRSFIVPPDAEALPLPAPADLLAQMPAHPRVFVTPATLAAFRSRREGASHDAWESIREKADALLAGKSPVLPRTRIPLAEAEIKHSSVSISQSWKKGDPIRRQVFWLDAKGAAWWTPAFSYVDLANSANKADVLSLAWLISGDERYAEAARKWLDHVAQFRIDWHLDPQTRAGHDTVVYAYEYGLKAAALAYDRLYDRLTPAERAAMIAHVEYHVESAGIWIRDKSLVHLNYQSSHVQQCMHALLTTVLATAKDSPAIDKWVAYIVPQYVNRIAWTSEDGGYFEGQTYGHKFAMILEGLAAIRTACGIDLFRQPALRNAGPYWLYAMNLNYWFNHWGDNYSLIWPWANPRDAYISGFLAAMTHDPYVKWYADTVLTDPENIPFYYISGQAPAARPPVDIPQARVFPLTGTVTAYDRFYDHQGARVFFRSSPWGAHSHSHADQNAFVIHAGGEILAPDTGYYTYSGDVYHQQWSKSTVAHNSMLVNGKGQPLNIGAKGRITEFFHGGRFTFFVGDASQAYEKPLETFRRALLFVRPGTWIVYDELKAGEPSKFTWLLNTFEQPDISPDTRRMVVRQQAMRLGVEHLLPEAIGYETGNKRPYPLKTQGKMWSRFTEAFPQPWHTEVTNATAVRDTAFLALLQSWREPDEDDTGNTSGAAWQADVTINTPSTVGAVLGAVPDGGAASPPPEALQRAPKSSGLAFDSISGDASRSVVLFRRQQASGVPADASAITGGGVSARAQAAAVLPDDWMLVRGTRLASAERLLWESTAPLNVSTSFSSPGAAALVRVDGLPSSGAPVSARLALPARPSRILIAPSEKPEQARPLSFTWDATKGVAVFSLPGQSAAAAASPTVLWIDPVVDITRPLSPATLEVKDSGGSHDIALQPAWAENGGVVYLAETSVRDPGLYTLDASASPDSGATAASASPVEFLMQDRWEPAKTARGPGPATGTLREGTWIFVHATPQDTAPRFTAALVQAHPRGQIDNLLRNGNFEEGSPGYPPRGWTFPTTSRKDTPGWGEWSQQDPAEGKSCLRFYRDKDARSLVSQPMRLLGGGEYHLRFRTRGAVRGAYILVEGARGRSGKVNINPSPDAWSTQTASIALVPGYTTLTIVFPAGPEAELWLDDIRFGKIQPSQQP
ncbi:heparinase [Opitutaceae bacterium TAV5]|nr:heparinase [Opitutaceae bacterium TAV5]